MISSLLEYRKLFIPELLPRPVRTVATGPRKRLTQIRSLNPTREPWQTSKRYGKGIYAEVLDLPVTDGTTVYFKWNQYRDRSMQSLKEVKVLTLALTGDKMASRV